MHIENTLRKIVADHHLHARWLNALSYLEYRGFRKMVKSQPSASVDDQLLTHSFEEVRHAMFFKKHAIDVGGDIFSTYREESLLCPGAIKKYFFDLDHQASGLMRESQKIDCPKTNYWVVTLLVEERAVALYQIYQKVLRECSSKIRLTALLNEEGKHLAEVLAEIKDHVAHWQKVKGHLKDFEATCFATLWDAIESTV